jgi:excisionase family DNA binding protein
MNVVAEPGNQANDELPDRGVVPRRPFEDVECPLTVREAARFLGVSPQTVYLWVERKQIPHLRVMGRNIRFLKSDLEPFRSRFKQEVEDGTTT